MDWEIITATILCIGAGVFALGTAKIIAEDKERERIRKLEEIMHEHNTKLNE